MIFPIVNTISTYLAGCFINSTFDSSLWAMSDKESMISYLAAVNLVYLIAAVSVHLNMKDEKEKKR